MLSRLVSVIVADADTVGKKVISVRFSFPNQSLEIV